MAGKALGKGLKALIADDFDFEAAVNTPEDQPLILELEISRIRPNKEQPRKIFDQEALQELADSIKIHGILQPLVVKKEDDGYTIIAGERRFRAAQIADLTTVPVIIKNLDARAVMEIALIENVQRENLNPMEEAIAYDKLIKEFGLIQNELAERLGKSRVAITNTLRLLKLPESVRQKVLKGELSAGHARALLGLSDPKEMETLADEIIAKKLSVRDAEAAVKKNSSKPQKKKSQKEPDLYLKNTEARLIRHFMTNTVIKGNADQGKIEIRYHSRDELNRILELMQLEEEK